MVEQLTLTSVEETFTDLVRRLAVETPRTRPFRVLVTGSRTWDDKPHLWRVLEEIRAHRPDMVVVHGACYPPEDGDGVRPEVAS